MLTRIEIDNFKSFSKFSLDIHAFTAILGQNASGKSNLFDAVQFLSRLAKSDVLSAMRDLRGEPIEFFRKLPNGEISPSMTFAVEVLIDPVVRDPWGADVPISQTRLRYELELSLTETSRGVEKVNVTKERVVALGSSTDKWLPRGRPISKSFKKRFVRYSGRKPAYLETIVEDEKLRFKFHQDGRAGRERPAESAETTNLSTATSADFRHLYALREEMLSWRMLQLDPAGLRKPTAVLSPDELLSDGSNLAAVLARLKATTASDQQPSGVLADIVADLHSVIPQVVDLNVRENAASREYVIDFILSSGAEFTSRVVSDGTLRVLALLTLLHDPKRHSVICFEEPENGVHPARLKVMIERFRASTIDPSSPEIGQDDVLSQMIINSHSLVVLEALAKVGALDTGEVVFADAVQDVTAAGVSGMTRMETIRKDALPAIFPGLLSANEVERRLSTEIGAA
jgi:predicted ATPase